MRKLKIFLILLILLNYCVTDAILFSFLKDLAIGVQALDELNRANREALFNGVKNMVGGTNGPIFRNNNTKKDPNSSDEAYSFKNIAGKIPQSILELVEFLSYPEKFDKMGAKRPRGILMYGPPGTGKTAIAKALAGEANAKFFHAKASEFIEIYVGVGPKRIRELFDSAKEAIAYGPHKSAIIFIDELDGIGSTRSLETNSEYKNAIGALLTEMDGFERNDSIMVLGATNMIDAIDPALKRPGRFDRIVEIGLPDEESRLAIIELYCQKINYDRTTNLAKYAESTRGWSPAELECFVNAAATRAVSDNADKTYTRHFDFGLQELMSQRRKAR